MLVTRIAMLNFNGMYKANLSEGVTVKLKLEIGRATGGDVAKSHGSEDSLCKPRDRGSGLCEDPEARRTWPCCVGGGGRGDGRKMGKGVEMGEQVVTEKLRVNLTSRAELGNSDLFLKDFLQAYFVLIGIPDSCWKTELERGKTETKNWSGGGLASICWNQQPLDHCGL